MDQSTKEKSKTAKGTDEAFTNIQVGLSTTESGKRETLTEKAS